MITVHRVQDLTDCGYTSTCPFKFNLLLFSIIVVLVIMIWTKYFVVNIFLVFKLKSIPSQLLLIVFALFLFFIQFFPKLDYLLNIF